MNQNCDASAPSKPANSDERHCLRLPIKAARLNNMSQTTSSAVWMASPHTRVVVARTRNEAGSRVRVAPRKVVAARAKKAPAARPRSTGRPLSTAPDRLPGLSEVTTTPAVAMMTAVAIAGVSGSPRTARPKTATCTGSVLM
jgi:hypothetical protein